MIKFDADAYQQMFGNIGDEFINAAMCIGQCTGCKCSCKCSCKNKEEDVLDWED